MTQCIQLPGRVKDNLTVYIKLLNEGIAVALFDKKKTIDILLSIINEVVKECPKQTEASRF